METKQGFYVYFLGTRKGEYIEAENMKSAKWIFALKNGLKSLAYITAHRSTNHGKH